MEEMVRSGRNPAWEAVMVREDVPGDRKVVTFKLSSGSVLSHFDLEGIPWKVLLKMQILIQRASGAKTLHF